MGGGGSKGAAAAHRARYEAAVTQVERDKEHNEAMLLQQKEAANKLEHAFHEKAAVERAAHDEKLRLEREKSDLLKESAAANLILVQENHERQRLILKEAEDKRLESERIRRENEIRLREENEQKREMDRSAAREREDRAQREMTKAINDANREVNDMKDKAHSDITKLVMENQKNKDDLMKENIKTMEAKDAANAEKLEKLTNTYQSQVKETQELAKQREDALHLERKAVDEKYRNDMEKMNKLSKEEQDKMTADYHKIIKEKDNELSRNQREKDAKMDELNKNHLADLREAHDNYNKLQETSKAEMMRLHKEKEEVIRESAAKQEEMAQKMLEMSERQNDKLFIMANEAIYAEARKNKEQWEIMLTIKCNEELAPIKSIKAALINNATESCELWILMLEPENDLNEIKRIITELLMKVYCNLRNFLEKKCIRSMHAVHLERRRKNGLASSRSWTKQPRNIPRLFE
ncbi:hypothetical protein PENTCL1PPCAC_26094 [Pristionchus entomophagus]|uniref:Uncharacterized protein n=1 Tax=Pristionchus entomophagus TaxID=358040 RepID=A0AAV5UAK3_9BILA|nr:hypothetical protein PENTCL1PPCAC_26094 [Pristionchus entomophagus]